MWIPIVNNTIRNKELDGYSSTSDEEFNVNDITIKELEKKTLISRHDNPDSDDGAGEFQMELSEQRNGSFGNGPASPTETQPSKGWAWFYVISASIMASLGGVLFGYDMGIISGAILQLRDVFCLSCLDQELVISAMLMGAVVGSLVGGFLIDHCGRRLTIIANSVVFLVGALILGFSPNFAILVVGRLLVGFAVSVSATGECIYISEIAPAKRRGLLVSLNELGITLGLLLAYLCNFLFISISGGWRWMFGLSAVPAVVQGIGMFFLPMSPRFLMLKKKEDDAMKVLKKLRGTNKVDSEISGIRVSIASEKNKSCTDVCGSEDGMRGRMFIGIGLVFFQQFTGQPNVLYYAPTIFEEIGFHSNSAATLATVGLGIVKVVMTIIALICVDKFGRRKLLYVGATVMGISIFTLGIVCHFESASLPNKACVDHSHCQSATEHTHAFATKIPDLSNSEHKDIISTTLKAISKRDSENNASGNDVSSLYNESTNVPLLDQNTQKNHSDNGFDNLGINNHSASNITKGDNSNHSSLFQRIAGFAALMCYVAAYGFSFGPVTWLVLSEIFPAAVKGRAIAIATVFNWGTNLIVTFTFLDVMNALGVTWTFTVFGVICAFSVMFIYSFVPETKNSTLEQVSAEMKTNVANMFKGCFCTNTQTI
ncbi:solute carrier family 2, facilitated glucose transporter member 10-like isoform X2 [Mercenaria mercenaria]|uniref:solute carrier family 2, facilitated glucose transporter member 10-like isoform X2 n=1 Tax=Mercenaria mercenaria TaxID=6596 RepID=UPI00234FA1F6|nr:solute carrier family 2, facilitated glucose transporter member 10-like isoform X2 [Mercenaria mercenaria]